MGEIEWTQIIMTVAIPIVVGVVLFIIEYWTGIFNVRQKKELNYETLSVSELVWSNTRNTIIDKDLEITLSGRPIRSLVSIVVRFTNTGNTPIKSSDFEDEILVGFKNSELFGLQISQSDPPNLIPELDANLTDSRRPIIKIAPTLMNAGESFTIAFLVGDYDWGGYTVDARIAGTRIVHRSLSERRAGRVMWATTIIMLTVLIVLVYLNYFYK